MGVWACARPENREPAAEEDRPRLASRLPKTLTGDQQDGGALKPRGLPAPHALPTTIARARSGESEA